MSPIQKLLRLKELTRRIQQAPPMHPFEGSTVTLALLEERDAILATVGTPAPELADNPNPAAHAAHFAEVFPMIGAETVYPWFESAVLAGVAAGRAQGFEEGRRLAPGMGELVDTLKLIRGGLQRGSIVAQKISNRERGTGPRPLVELVVEALAGVGVTE